MVKIDLAGLKIMNCGNQATIKATVYYKGQKSETLCLQFDAKSKNYPVTYTSPVLKKTCSPNSTTSFEWPIIIQYAVGDSYDITAKAWPNSDPSLQVTKTEKGLISVWGKLHWNDFNFFDYTYQREVVGNTLNIKFQGEQSNDSWYPGSRDEEKLPVEFGGWLYPKGSYVKKDLWQSMEKVVEDTLEYGVYVDWFDYNGNRHKKTYYVNIDSVVWLKYEGEWEGDIYFSIFYLSKCTDLSRIIGVSWSKIDWIRRVKWKFIDSQWVEFKKKS